MKKVIDEIYRAQGSGDLQSAVNAMERIAVAETDKWEPRYYAAYGYIMMSMKVDDAAKKDGYLDRAMAEIEKATSLAPTESEVVALKGFAQMMRLAVDPASRGAQYSQLAFDAFGKALTLDPENPRALALLAQMQLGTAKFFKSPATESCETLNRALEKFETHESTNVLAPVWGKKMAESMKDECK